jgi:ubiquinone/menaquinone biosynthesis C-methylase UbiE
LKENAANILKRVQQVGIHFAPDQTVIDIGCSDGLLIEQIRERWSCNTIGVDVDQRMIETARQKYPKVHFIHGRLDQIAPTLPAADVIIASAILEHVISPPNFLATLNGLLKSNGQLFVLTPNSASRNYRLQRSWWRELLAIGEHIYLFGPRSFTILANGVGLQPEAMATAYDRTTLSFRVGSAKDLVVFAWALLRYGVKRLCQLRTDDLKGDILFARLRQKPKT